MNTEQLSVQFRHMPKSKAIKELVRQQADRLCHLGLDQGRCEVVIDETNHGRKGSVFRVAVAVSLPGRRRFAAHAEEKSSSSEYLYAAVRLAFESIEHQLEKRSIRNHRREVKVFTA